MGKRSDFERVPRDFYPTPTSAVAPLLPHLKPETVFSEPCVGSGDLLEALESAGHICGQFFDIEPRGESYTKQADARTAMIWSGSQCVITNPPWSRDMLHPIIENLSQQKPTWLLFDADWMHTRQSAPFMPYLRKIVSVGRVKWIPDSPFTGKDNCCWYRFDQNSRWAVEYPAQFVGRAA